MRSNLFLDFCFFKIKGEVIGMCTENFIKFLELKKEDNGICFKWLMTEWDNLKVSTREKFFRDIFREFCRGKRSYGENAVEILLAISLSSKFDDVNKQLEVLSNKWGQLIRNLFDEMLVKISKEINEEGFFEVVKNILLLEINHLRKEKKLVEMKYYIFDDGFNFHEKMIELKSPSLKELLRKIIEETVKDSFAFYSASKVRLKIEKTDNIVKVFLYYYK